MKFTAREHIIALLKHKGALTRSEIYAEVMQKQKFRRVTLASEITRLTRSGMLYQSHEDPVLSHYSLSTCKPSFGVSPRMSMLNGYMPSAKTKVLKN